VAAVVWWLVFACGLLPGGRRQICKSFPPPLIAPSTPALLVLGGPWSPDLVRLGCGSGGSPGEILGRCGPATTVTTSTLVPLPGGSVEVLFPSPPLAPGENLILLDGAAAALYVVTFLEVPLRWFERCEGVLIWGLGDRRSRGPILSFCASFLSTFNLDSFIPSCVALCVWARIFQGELVSAGGGAEYLSRLFVAAILSGSRVSFPIFRRYGVLRARTRGRGPLRRWFRVVCCSSPLLVQMRACSLPMMGLILLVLPLDLWCSFCGWGHHRHQAKLCCPLCCSAWCC